MTEVMQNVAEKQLGKRKLSECDENKESENGTLNGICAVPLKKIKRSDSLSMKENNQNEKVSNVILFNINL